MWKVTLALLAVLSPSVSMQVQLSPIYQLSTLEVMHMRKGTRPSVFFVHCQTKMAQAWGQG